MSGHRARSSHLPRTRCEAEDCTVVFVPYHRRQRFCSEKCRELERARERRASEGAGTPARRKRFTCDALAAVMAGLSACGKVRTA